MGTTYTYGATRADIIREITTPWSSEGTTCKTLRHCARGNVVYALHERHNAGAESAYRFIGVYLLSRSPDGWGYKPMDETSHPYYYDCPPSYLAIADELPLPYPSEMSERWRELVRQNAAVRNRTFEPGSVVHTDVPLCFRGHPLQSFRVVKSTRRMKNVHVTDPSGAVAGLLAIPKSRIVF